MVACNNSSLSSSPTERRSIFSDNCKMQNSSDHHLAEDALVSLHRPADVLRVQRSYKVLAKATPSSGSSIRSRLLRKLGISQSKDSPDLDKLSLDDCYTPDLEGTSYNDSSSDFTSLQDSRHRSMSFADSSCGQGHRNRGVNFDETVVVHPIPSRSSLIRQDLWPSPAEVKENMTRNCVEFAAEGWDWRSVVDEDKMVHYRGELVHPCHFEQCPTMNRFFTQVMSAQRHTPY